MTSALEGAAGGVAEDGTTLSLAHDHQRRLQPLRKTELRLSEKFTVGGGLSPPKSQRRRRTFRKVEADLRDDEGPLSRASP